MFIEILIILLLLLANGIFAMSEIAIVSARRARLQPRADSGDRQAQAAINLAAAPNQFLATVQIGITLIGILAGAFGGATVAEKIEARLDAIPPLAPYSESIGVAIVVIIITYCSVIIGELVPKRLALNNAERIATMIARPMQTLSALTAPVVWLLSSSTDLVFRLLRIKPAAEPAITPEEIKVLVELGTETGAFEESEQDMIEGVLRLDERPISAFMTPRTQIVAFDIADSPEVIQRKIAESQHSRYPVVNNNLDAVMGFVRAKDLLNQSLSCLPIDVSALLRSPLFVPESLSALRVLELFKEKGVHLALITDEYGGIEGMVTVNDILEGIAGTISAPGEPDEPQATVRPDGSWLVDGLLDIDDLKEIFHVDQLPGEDLGHFQTVGGFVIAQFRSIPSAGQYFIWRNMRFEVIDMDGRRVDKLLITPQPAAEGQSEE